MSARLRIALEAGGLSLPETGTISVLRPAAEMDLSDLPRDRLEIVQPVKPDFDHFKNTGYESVAASDTPVAMTLVCLPRAKALAQALIAEACSRSDGLVAVDGSKTDGVDSLLKACLARVAVSGPISKAHGKLFWFSATDTFNDWCAPAEQMVDGFVTAPGVFSADGPDPASVALLAALPRLAGHVVDLGAGWGFLSAGLLQQDGIKILDLVEADATALECARQNVRDPRTQFHWADATTWTPATPVDAVVMNPPFHTGRAADPSLGRSFIDAAARVLAPSGQLWMVANRHLPYEATLTDRFASVEEIAGDTKFKVLRAQRPIRARKSAVPRRTRR
ncbi:class I SAM-dependent methyltransferase [Sedimentitalea arenosa]|uniref:Class I SAM-dependent methyltransferase n=1 Tax=Sedimentitalea arenosa TaxID=2798803 RepID=A0A8J7J2P1_9RHOB|nr:methyltransferase [Arenibacterium arenosum]MBJ6372475.1 class I SAM-dependent methyltransferase [Arenibacterium arenosum]